MSWRGEQAASPIVTDFSESRLLYKQPEAGSGLWEPTASTGYPCAMVPKDPDNTKPERQTGRVSQPLPNKD